MHTSTNKGKRVFVILTDGTNFVDKFVTRKSKSVVFEERGAILKKRMRSMTIARQTTA